MALTFQPWQKNPVGAFTQGAQAGQQMKTTQQKQAYDAEILKTLPALLQAELGTAQSTALIKGEEAKFAPQTAEADYFKKLADLAKVQMDAQKLSAELPYAARMAEAEVGQKEAMAQYYNMGGSNIGVGANEIRGLKYQVSRENPNWDEVTVDAATSAYLDGSYKDLGLPPPSGQVMTMVAQSNKRNSTAEIQNKASNLDVLAKSYENINIDPIKEYAGTDGQAKAYKYAVEMAAGRDVPQSYRDYLTFKSVTQYFNMDQLRASFGTSVIPDYVQRTLGGASDPTSTWWKDSKQVDNDWNSTKKWLQNETKAYMAKATKGVGADIREGNVISSMAERAREMSDAELDAAIAKAKKKRGG